MMKRAQAFVVVLMTAPDKKSARAIAEAALRARLVACANLIPGIESHYWWQGKVESASEVLVLFKARRRSVRALEKLVLSMHPYDTPALVTLGIESGSGRYLDWLAGETTPAAR